MVKKKFMVLGLLIVLAVAGCVQKIDLGKDRPEILEKDLKFYPYFFFDEENKFNALIIVDEFAPEEDIDTAEALLEHYNEIDDTITEAVIKRYPDEYWDLTEQNSILIGSCSQEPHNKFINIFVDCLSMRDGQAIVRIINNHDVWVLNIMGKTPIETRNAVKALMNYENYVLQDYHVEVISENGELIVRGPR